MFTKEGLELAEIQNRILTRELREISNPKLLKKACEAVCHHSSLIVYGKWPEGVVARWEANSGGDTPKEIVHIEDGDTDMAYGCAIEYIRGLKRIERHQSLS